jgi:hypothetical protein
LVFIDPDKTDLDIGLKWFSLDKPGHWIWTVFSLDGLSGFLLDLDFLGFSKVGFASFVLNCTMKLRAQYAQTKYYGINYYEFGDEH